MYAYYIILCVCADPHWMPFHSPGLVPQDSFQRILYKPPEWFVGEDQVVLRVSDGGVSGDNGGNLTGELGFKATWMPRKGQKSGLFNDLTYRKTIGKWWFNGI